MHLTRAAVVMLGVVLCGIGLCCHWFPADLPGKKSDELGDEPHQVPALGKLAGDSLNGAHPKKPRGPVLGDWPKPEAVLVFSGQMNGYIEPCGCAGKENMKGGLARRHGFFQELRGRGWEVVPLDLGGQIKRFGPQAEIKYAHIMGALKTMGYAATTFGSKDLTLPATLNAALAPGNSFLSANVGLADQIPKYRIVQAGERKIAVTAILGDEYRQQLSNSFFELKSAEEALVPVVKEMKQAADYLVLLSHAKPQESVQLAKTFAEFDVVLTASETDIPPGKPTQIEGTKTKLIEVGHKGMYLGVLGLFPDEEPRYQRLALSSRFEETQEMYQVMVNYQAQLKHTGLKGIGATTKPHPSGLKFVGSAACADCHPGAHEKWSSTPHAKALDTLNNLDPPRHHDAECLSCHVVGWNPQKYHPYESGYLSLTETPKLQHNGCENCHGPGSAHVAAEWGELEITETKLAELRKQMWLPLDQAEKTCVECHDADNSPAFQFQEYWKEVDHSGLD